MPHCKSHNIYHSCHRYDQAMLVFFKHTVSKIVTSITKGTILNKIFKETNISDFDFY